MKPWFDSIRQLEGNEDRLRQRRYGMIEVIEGKLVRVHFRPWPKLISATEVAWLGGWQHRHDRHRDRCRLYYNQPLGHSNFLALKYVISSFATRYRTFFQATVVLDQIAQIKRTDAILAEVTNPRITDRMMERWGWQPHLLDRRGRHFIKRFYGTYPAHARLVETEKRSLLDENLAFEATSRRRPRRGRTR